MKYLYEIFNADYFSRSDVGIVCNISSSLTDFPCPIPKSRKRKEERKTDFHGLQTQISRFTADTLK